MKNLKVLIGLMAFIAVTAANINAKPLVHNTTVKDSIHVWASPDLVEIATTWVSAYEKFNPEAKINVSTTSADNVSNMIEKSGNIGLITKNYLPVEGDISSWKMEVGRDVIVPVINSENPFIEEIFSKGISQEEFTSIFVNSNPTWGTLLNNDMTNKVNCFCTGTESIKPYLSEFLKTDLNNFKGIQNTDKMLKKIQNDKYSLGFCRLVDIIDSETQEMKEGFSLIPIDVNGNNKVDLIENIYSNTNTLERGVWIGKYPTDLFSHIYTISEDQPVNDSELAFLEWIITDGQQYLFTDGYTELILSERQRKVQKLHIEQTPIIKVEKPARAIGPVLIIVFAIVGFFAILITIGYFQSKKPVTEINHKSMAKVFSETSVEAPNGIFFDKSHTWAFMEKDGHVKIGVADFLQRTTGEITSVNMKNKGERVKKGEPFLTVIQHGKHLNILSPVTGTILETNSRLNSSSSLINSSPYSEGWVYEIASTNWLKDIQSFYIGETYQAWLKNEFTRLKNFFSSALKLDVTNNLQVVFQDGGELSDSPMENFGPEVWEEFQTEFIYK